MLSLNTGSQITSASGPGSGTLSPRKMLSEPPESHFSPRCPGILVGMKAILSLLWHLLRMSRSRQTAPRALWGTDEFLATTGSPAQR